LFLYELVNLYKYNNEHIIKMNNYSSKRGEHDHLSQMMHHTDIITKSKEVFTKGHRALNILNNYCP
jgi:hypothetical protein